MYHYSWLELTGGVEAIEHALHLAPNHALAILGSWLVCLLLTLVALVGRAGLNRARARGGTEQYLADGSLTVRNMFELLTEGLDDLLGSILG